MKKFMKQILAISLVALSCTPILNSMLSEEQKRQIEDAPIVYDVNSNEFKRVEVFMKTLKETIFPTLFATDAPANMDTFIAAYTLEFSQPAYATFNLEKKDTVVKTVADGGNAKLYANPETVTTKMLMSASILILFNMVRSGQACAQNIKTYFSKVDGGVKVNRVSFLQAMCDAVPTIFATKIRRKPGQTLYQKMDELVGDRLDAISTAETIQLSEGTTEEIGTPVEVSLAEFDRVFGERVDQRVDQRVEQKFREHDRAQRWPRWKRWTCGILSTATSIGLIAALVAAKIAANSATATFAGNLAALGY